VKKLREIMRRLLKGQRGFTLIEILVAVGILAILAGVAVPVVVQFIGSSETKAQTAEASDVQVAVDALMVKEEVSLLTDLTCTLPVGETQDMTAFPCTEGGTLALSPTYMRQATTLCNYTVVASGLVSQGTCP